MKTLPSLRALLCMLALGPLAAAVAAPVGEPRIEASGFRLDHTTGALVQRVTVHLRDGLEGGDVPLLRVEGLPAGASLGGGLSRVGIPLRPAGNGVYEALVPILNPGNQPLRHRYRVTTERGTVQ